MWLSGRLHIKGRLNEGPRLQRKHKDENEAKQNKRNTRERRHDICKPNARRVQVRATCGYSQQGRANQHEPACFGLSSSWSYPSISGIHTTACRSPALAFSAAIHFAMKCSAPCSAVLRHFPSSWAAVVKVGIDAESSEVVPETPDTLFFLAPHTTRAPHQFSEHHPLRQSRILHARHKSRKQDPPPA